MVGPQDLASVYILPSFVSSTNLRCTGPPELDNRGICIPGSFYDTFGNLRENPPDLGVNEYMTKIYKTWLGDTSPFWDQPSNWSPFGVPTAVDDVRLTKGLYEPTIQIGGAICHDLLVDPGVTLHVNPWKYLNIMGILVLVKYCP